MRSAANINGNIVREYVMLVSMLRMNILLGYKVNMVDRETLMYFLLAKDHAPSLASNVLGLGVCGMNL